MDQPQASFVASDELPWTTVVEPSAPSGRPGDAPVSMRRVIVAVALAALVVLGIVAFAGSVIAKRIAERQGVHDGAVMADLLATSAVQPRLTDAMLTNPAAAARAFGQIASAVVVDPVTRIKIWRPDGEVLWSDDPTLIGQRFALDGDARK